MYSFSPGPSGDVKNESDKVVGHRGRLDQAIIHGLGVEVCCPASPVQEQCYKAKDYNARTLLTRISKISFVRTMLYTLNYLCTH